MILRLLNRALETGAERIEHADGLDAVGDPLAAAVDQALGSGPATDLLSGTPIGHPVHPLLVTVPLGAWTCSLVFDLFGEKKAADALIGLGLVTAAPAVAAGLSDWRHTEGAERRVGLVHALGNAVALAAYGASWTARRRGHRATGIGLSLLGATAVSVGGWLGGHLAYALGVGVDTTAFQQSEPKWTHLVDEADLTGDGLQVADLEGVPVLIVRTDDGIVALADRCTHRGAPLHEGELRDGCVVCPWHASTFALDGSVESGPATRPQKAYEVQVTDGRVLVRSAAEPRTLRTNPVGR